MVPQPRAYRARPMIPVLFMMLAVLACSIGGQQLEVTVTPGGLGPTLVAQSDVPDVEIRSPQDKSEVVIQTEVQVYVRAVDKVGVTRVEMRVDNLIVDTAASPEANGTTSMDSILSWTPNSVGPHVIEVVAFRANTRGNPKQITLTVRQNASDVTQPAGSPAFLTASPSSDPTCRVRINVDNLNLRTGPGINYDQIATLSLGTSYQVLGMNGDGSWYEVNAAGVIGWVSGAFVTRQGICSTLVSVPIPPSPTVRPGATIFILPPTFTPLPTQLPPTPSSTIPVVVLPTLTFTPFQQQPQGPSAGDLSSTAIFATQTKIAQPTPKPSKTSPPGITATVTNTPTITPTPVLPNLTITGITISGTTVVLDPVQKLATVPFVVKVSNTGDADAAAFQVAIDLPEGKEFSVSTGGPLKAKAEIELSIPVTFTKEGIQNVAIRVDSTNSVVESNENDNVAFQAMTVVVATPQGATATFTATFTPTTVLTLATTAATQTATNTSTSTPTHTPTHTATATTAQVGTAQATTATATNTATFTPTFTATPTLVIPGTTEVSQVASATPTHTATSTATFTLVPTLATAAATNTPTATFTWTPIPPPIVATTVVPTNTPTHTPTAVPPTTVAPTNTPTHTPTAVPPTIVPTTVAPTNTPTHTPTAVPPTVIPTTVAPTNTPTHTPTAVPPTVVPTTVVPTNTPTNTPTAAPTAAATAAPPPVDMLSIPVAPDLNNPQVHNKIAAIYNGGKDKKTDPHQFLLVGDATLRNVKNVADPSSNLAQVNPGLFDVANYFKTGITGADGPTSADGFTSADILANNKGTGTCKGKSPLNCALGANPLIVFISVGRADAGANVPLDAFRANLTKAVQDSAGKGTIPVLVSITGTNPPDDAKVAQYNNVIYQVAQAEQVPLFNVFAVKKDDAGRIDGTGQLSAPPAGKQADFSLDGLKAGQNDATFELLQLLSNLKAVLALP